MGDIVNLKRVRKEKARKSQTKNAVSNRVKFGQTKEEKLLASAKMELAERLLTGHKKDN